MGGLDTPDVKPAAVMSRWVNSHDHVNSCKEGNWKSLY